MPDVDEPDIISFPGPVTLPQRLRSLAPLGVALIWGVNIPVMKAAIGVLHPFAFNALRLTVSVATLFWIERRARRGAAPPPTPWAEVALVAVLSGFLYQLLFLGGMGRTSAGHTAVLIGSSPIWTTALARLVGLERHPRPVWVGLAVALLGTLLVVSDASGASSLTGDAMVFGAALAWAAGTILSRRLLERTSALRLAYLLALVALPAHWLVAWPLLSWDAVRAAPSGFWWAVLYAGVLSTGVAYVLWNVGLLAVGAARTAIYVNLVPVIATAIAWGVLGERVGTREIAGTALVVVGLIAVQRFQARANASATRA